MLTINHKMQVMDGKLQIIDPKNASYQPHYRHANHRPKKASQRSNAASHQSHESKAIHKNAIHRKKDCNTTIFPALYRQLSIAHLKKTYCLVFISDPK